MESSEKSPIIERLCKFMESSGLTVTQFADKAGIPRPSLSQMLHGRNKSLNNQVLGKLNAAFPELNIVWLLFGNGSMRTDANFEISDGQNDGKTSLFSFQNPEDEPIASSILDESPTSPQGVKEEEMPPYGNSRMHSRRFERNPPEQSEREADTSTQFIRTIAESGAKKVKSIIVLYSDGSFESFIPGSRE